MEQVATKWNLDRDVQFSTRVIALDWLEDDGKWKIRVQEDGQERDEFADVLVSAQGFLRQVNYPFPEPIPDSWTTVSMGSA